jgi:hypothetical protein
MDIVGVPIGDMEPTPSVADGESGVAVGIAEIVGVLGFWHAVNSISNSTVPRRKIKKLLILCILKTLILIQYTVDSPE